MALNNNDLLLINDSNDGNKAKRVKFETLKNNIVGAPGSTEYVEVVGDNMTGDLTLGTDKITLNATDGSGSFSQNKIYLGSNGDDVRISLRNEGQNQSHIVKAGNDTIGLTNLSANAGTANCAITFNTNTGSAEFAGYVQMGPSYDNVGVVPGKGDGTSPSQLVVNGRPAAGGNEAFRIDSFAASGTTATTVAKVLWNGSAEFAGTVTENATRSGSVEILLEQDDDTKYTTTTDSEGNVTRVYNGAVLDVKDRIQNVLARMDAIEANEITDDATDSALLSLVASLTARLDERDAQIAALTARVTTLETA